MEEQLLSAGALCSLDFEAKQQGAYHLFWCKKDEAMKMKAHAWLRVGDRIITGIKGHRGYTVLGKFACLP